MLFEIHDIILHRLWKHAKKMREKGIDIMLSRKALEMSDLHYWLFRRYYYALLAWYGMTKQWYLNHVRRCSAVGGC